MSLILLFLICYPAFKLRSLPSISWKRSFLQASPDFDEKSFAEALKSAGPLWSNKINKMDEGTFENIKKEQAARSEEIFSSYPFDDVKLPILNDCNNYYSGKFGEYFWHQNADQIYVYIPITNDILKTSISVKFEAKSVAVSLNDEELVSFECLERIIPDGSFWIIESDDKNNRYIQLDLEKRFRMINWKNLFGQPTKESKKELEGDRAKLLDKLFSANKGMSKLTGKPAESMDDMLSNENLMRMINNVVETKAKKFVDVENIGVNDDVTSVEEVDGSDDFYNVNIDDDENRSNDDAIDAEVVDDSLKE
jgi:hypothetical protein